MMRKFQVVFGLVFILLFFGSCASVSKGEENSGNLKINNQSGVELAVYVNELYKDTVKNGNQVDILVDNVETQGTIVKVEVFLSEKLSNLKDYPTNQDAKYWSFPKVIRPLNDPMPVTPIYIRKLTDDDLQNNIGVDSVLVKFSYNDFPMVDSTVSVFTGSENNQNPIVRLQNGQSMFAPMEVKLNPISVEYYVGGKNIQREVYPKTNNQIQRNDERFVVVVRSDQPETEHVIPLISDVFNISYTSNNRDAQGTLRTRNNSSQMIDVRISSGTESERQISPDSGLIRNERRDFSINQGSYVFRAVDALNGGFKEIAKIEDVMIEPGMIYYWFITDQGSSLDTRVDMTVSQQIKDWFQTWIIDTNEEDGVKITLRITSTANEVQNSRRELGVVQNNQLVLRSIDIENLIRGLTTDNAKRVILTILAEKEGYESASQSISAYDLLTAGENFRPQQFTLTKSNTPMEDMNFLIGDPIIQ